MASSRRRVAVVLLNAKTDGTANEEAIPIALLCKLGDGPAIAKTVRVVGLSALLVIDVPTAVSGKCYGWSMRGSF